MHRLDERDAWIDLNSYNGAAMLDHQDQIRVQGLIYRARLRDSRIESNAARFIERAAKIGLKPVAEPGVVQVDAGLCKPILPSAEAGG